MAWQNFLQSYKKVGENLKFIRIYNPQNEMFARFQTKRSIQQNEMSSQLPRKSLFSSLT